MPKQIKAESKTQVSKTLTCRWKWEIASPLYEISSFDAPFLISGRSDMASRTVVVRKGADDSREMFDWNCEDKRDKNKPPIQIFGFIPYKFLSIGKYRSTKSNHCCERVYLLVVDHNCELNGPRGKTVCGLRV